MAADVPINYAVLWTCGGCPDCGGALFRLPEEPERKCLLCSRAYPVEKAPATVAQVIGEDKVAALMALFTGEPVTASGVAA